MPSALVFGSAGQLGAAVVLRLLTDGWTVWAVTREGRRPPGDLIGLGARPLDGTERSRASVIDDVGAPVDAVFDPTAYDRADAEDLLGARGKVGGLVVVSTAGVYAGADGRSLVGASQSGVDGSDKPIDEEAPTVAAGEADYFTRKAAMEQALLASGAPVSVLRPCAVHGPYATHPREWWFIKRALDGRTAIPVAYGARSIFHTSSAAGLAELAAKCMRAPESRVLNVADDDALSVREIARCIAGATGLDMPITPFEGAPVGPAHVGSTPWSTAHAFVLDTARARGLGWTGGRYRDRVGAACQWALEIVRDGDWRAQFSGFSDYGYDPFDYAAEDRLLAKAYVRAPRRQRASR
jgi:nucleoside-diphosphate-sugar epimerase